MSGIDLSGVTQFVVEFEIDSNILSAVWLVRHEDMYLPDEVAIQHHYRRVTQELQEAVRGNASA